MRTWKFVAEVYWMVLDWCIQPQDEGWSLSLLKVDHHWELDGGEQG